MFRCLLISAVLLFGVNCVSAQQQPNPAPMHDMQSMGEMQPSNENTAPAVRAMSSHHMHMDAHMKMTALRPPKPGDAGRADGIAWTAGLAIDKYRDYKTALADGFKIFLPNVPQQVYHFTNYVYGLQATVEFDPEHPTSLLYEKTSDGFRLVGAMYTAPARVSEDELDKRVPLSVAQWHQHVNFCVPPRGRNDEMFLPHPRFGLNGSISTQQACDKAGGRFYPRIFGWMVHVYPFEEKREAVWAVEPPEGNESGHSHMD
jgi:hypothetical protein